jgi:hypothetical protein
MCVEMVIDQINKSISLDTIGSGVEEFFKIKSIFLTLKNFYEPSSSNKDFELSSDFHQLVLGWLVHYLTAFRQLREFPDEIFDYFSDLSSFIQTHFSSDDSSFPFLLGLIHHCSNFSVDSFFLKS